MTASAPFDITEDRCWFTSDLHFGHARILEYCRRPFATVEEMDNALITNWNLLVRPEDTVFVVGDFSLASKQHQIRKYRERLRGSIVLIRGNHDSRKGFIAFDQVEDLLRVRVTTEQPMLRPLDGQPYMLREQQTLVLCHYGMEVWEGAHKGAWHLHGHSHGTLPRRGRRMDVGVDCHSFAPVSFAQVANVLSQVPFERVDAHKERT